VNRRLSLYDQSGHKIAPFVQGLRSQGIPSLWSFWIGKRGHAAGLSRDIHHISLPWAVDILVRDCDLALVILAIDFDYTVWPDA
jgi:hypothetical protein